MNWLSPFIFALFVGASLGRYVGPTPDVTELSKTSPVKYFITGQKDANGHWTEQVKMEHGDEDWHIEVDHMTLEVGEDQPKVKITATFSAKSKTPGVIASKPEDSPAPVESKQVSEVYQLFPRSDRDWFGAQADCEEWGGNLAIPNTRAKMFQLAEILGRHIDKTGESTGAFLGFNDLKREGHFVTVLGKPLFGSKDSTWSPQWFQNDQPDDDKSWSKDGEDCGSLRYNGGLNDVPCRYNLPYICEKVEVEGGAVDSVAPKDKDDEDTSLQLFLHSSVDWFGARKACIKMGGHLAIPDSQAKMLKMTEMLKSRTDGDASAFVGFNDIKEEGQFVTIFGKPVFSSSASWSPPWCSPAQPDDEKSWTTQGEDCGAIRSNGGLNDVPCRYFFPYFCEKTSQQDADTTAASLEDLFEGESSNEIVLLEDAFTTPTFLEDPIQEESSDEIVLLEDAFTTPTSLEDPIQEESSDEIVLLEDAFTTPTSLEDPIQEESSDEIVLQEDAVTTPTSLEELLEELDMNEWTLHQDVNTTPTSTEEPSEEQRSEKEETSPQLDSLKLFSRDDLDWYEANGACKEWGGHLAIPDSAEKMEVMTLKMKQANVPAAFLGFGDQEQEGYFVTIFAKPVFNKLSWSPKWWRDDQPDDDKSWYDEGEDCGSVRSDGGLNDVPCRYRMSFFCEKSLPVETTNVPTYDLTALNQLLANENTLTNDDLLKLNELLSKMFDVAQNLPTLDDSRIVFEISGEESSTEEASSEITNAVLNQRTFVDSSRITFPNSQQESSTEELFQTLLFH